MLAELRPESESQFYAGVTGEWRGGLFVATYTALAIGTHVAVEFALPDEPPRFVLATGEITWVRDAEGASPGVGVRLDPLPDEVDRAIRDYCVVRPPLVHEDVGAQARAS